MNGHERLLHASLIVTKQQAKASKAMISDFGQNPNSYSSYTTRGYMQRSTSCLLPLSEVNKVITSGLIMW